VSSAIRDRASTRRPGIQEQRRAERGSGVGLQLAERHAASRLSGRPRGPNQFLRSGARPSACRPPSAMRATSSRQQHTGDPSASRVRAFPPRRSPRTDEVPLFAPGHASRAPGHPEASWRNVSRASTAQVAISRETARATAAMTAGDILPVGSWDGSRRRSGLYWWWQCTTGKRIDRPAPKPSSAGTSTSAPPGNGLGSPRNSARTDPGGDRPWQRAQLHRMVAFRIRVVHRRVAVRAADRTKPGAARRVRRWVAAGEGGATSPV
jgi:hypothetical protein